MGVERERGDGDWFRLSRYDVAGELQWKRLKVRFSSKDLVILTAVRVVAK